MGDGSTSGGMCRWVEVGGLEHICVVCVLCIIIGQVPRTQMLSPAVAIM
jgi:hypothetical protein